MSCSSIGLQPRPGELSLQLADVVLGDLSGGRRRRRAEVGVQHHPSRPQHPVDLFQELRHVRVAVRGLDVEDDVEAGVGERQVLRVPAAEAQPGSTVAATAVADRRPSEVHPRQRTGPEAFEHERRALSAAAADLEHVLAGDVARPRHGAVEGEPEATVVGAVRGLAGCGEPVVDERRRVVPATERHDLVEDAPGELLDRGTQLRDRPQDGVEDGPPGAYPTRGVRLGFRSHWLNVSQQRRAPTRRISASLRSCRCRSREHHRSG